jgi:hypothetical protein
MDMSRSVLFGPTTRALTFSQCTALLREMTTIDKDAKTRLIILAEVRNKIAHDARATYIMNAITDARRKWLMKHYEDDDTIEDPDLVEAAFFKMADEAIAVVKEELGKGTRHSDRTEAQILAEARLNARMDGVDKGLHQTMAYLIGETLGPRKWTIEEVAYVPIITMTYIRMEIDKELQRINSDTGKCS